MWPCVPACVLVTFPKLLFCRLLSGYPYCGVLAMLKLSNRNCILWRSVTGKSLNTEKSSVRVGGALLVWSPRLPPDSGPGGATPEVSNHTSGLRPPAGSAPGSLPGTRSGRHAFHTPWHPFERSVYG